MDLTLTSEPLDTSLHRDQRTTVSVREVDTSSEYSENLDQNFRNRMLARNARYKELNIDTRSPSSQEEQAERIRSTLAKMTKNYHAHQNDNSSFEQNEREAWNAIVIGDRIMNNVRTHLPCSSRIRLTCQGFTAQKDKKSLFARRRVRQACIHKQDPGRINWTSIPIRTV